MLFRTLVLTALLAATVSVLAPAQAVNECQRYMLAGGVNGGGVVCVDGTTVTARGTTCSDLTNDCRYHNAAVTLGLSPSGSVTVCHRQGATVTCDTLP